MLKAAYRAIVPAPIRRSRLAARVRGALLRHPIAHNLIYDAEYYARTVEGPALASAGPIADSIVRDLRPRDVIDVGCGSGALLEALRDRGCRVFGLEYSRAALAYCRDRRLDVTRFDLEKDALQDERTFDVAVSMEVAEHLPESFADRYVDLLTRVAGTVVFTAAPPGQDGNDHVNEQPPAYWHAKFDARGFRQDDELARRWREEWRAGGQVRGWYHQNLMLFRRG